MKAMSVFSIVFAAMTSISLFAGCAGSPDDERGDAAAGAGGPSLTGTRWALETLGEKPAEVADTIDDRPYLMFSADDEGVSGFTGVNFLSGTYERDGDALQFSPLITTKRAGPPALMQQETEFTRALEQTAGWRIREGGLELLNADGNVLARFQTGGGPTTAPAGQ